MSAIDTRMGARRAVAQNAAERRKKIILIGLAVVFVALLAFQLPKLLKGSGSSSSTSSTPAAATATPAAGTAVSQSLASSSTTVSVKRVRAIRHMSPKDPFMPLIKESTSTTSSSSSASSSSSSSSSSTPASAPAPVDSQPAINFTPPAETPAPTHVKPAVTKPVHVKPAAPTAAVVWTNGQRQVVGIGQVFNVGDAQFRLVAVAKKTMRFEVVGGAFAGGKHTITVRKNHRIKLANTATGVEYRLLFARGTTEAPTVVEAKPTTQQAQPQPSSPTQTSDSTSSTESSSATPANGS
jgi:hypothetical protein